MSFFNGSAIAVMLKPMFPQVFERVERMEADGTMAKIQSDIALIANSDALPAIAELARGLKEHNELLREIRDRMIADDLRTFPRSDTGAAGPLRLDGPGMPVTAGAD